MLVCTLRGPLMKPQTWNRWNKPGSLTLSLSTFFPSLVFNDHAQNSSQISKRTALYYIFTWLCCLCVFAGILMSLIYIIKGVEYFVLLFSTMQLVPFLSWSLSWGGGGGRVVYSSCCLGIVAHGWQGVEVDERVAGGWGKRKLRERGADWESEREGNGMVKYFMLKQCWDGQC